MIDIDVEGNRRYGVIEQGSRAHKALRQLRSDLITARLSSADGERPHLSAEHVGRVLGFKQDVVAMEISHLVRIGVLAPVYSSIPHEAPVFNYTERPEDRQRNYQYMPHITREKGFALAAPALEALNLLKAGEDYARFPFP